MCSDQEVSDCQWRSHGVEFHTTFKVLPLGCYDAILGIDWLATHSPMQVHWLEKTMSFECQGKRVHLQGAQADTTSCQMISKNELNFMIQTSAIARVVQLCTLQEQAKEPPLPAEVSELIEQYEVLFEEPRGLPPH